MQINNGGFYLDMIKEVQGLTTDYKVAKMLNLPPNKMADLRHNRCTLDSKVAIDVAVLARVDVSEVLFNAKAFKARRLGDEAAMRNWVRLSRHAHAIYLLNKME